MAHDPVAEAHGLRGLEVGEPGHEQADVLLGHVGHGHDELGQQLHDLLHLPAQVQPHVRRYLVVAAAAWGAERTRRTQGLGSQSYPLLLQPGWYGHEDSFPKIGN